MRGLRKAVPTVQAFAGIEVALTPTVRSASIRLRPG